VQITFFLPFLLPFLAQYAIVFGTMSQDKLIILKNKESGDVYFSRKNRKTVEKKIELKKYSSRLRKHVAFKEAKK
jgi:large subunit ribosomal protein L33